MRKIVKKIHLWLSIPAGVFITLICLTGAALVFQYELLELFYPKRYYVKAESGAVRMPLDMLVEMANSQIDSDTVQSVLLTPEINRTVQMTLTSNSRNSLFIDPYTGDITGYYNSREGFFHKMMTLHRWLMMSDRATGKIIIGTSTILFIFIMISGLIRWVPRNGKVWRKALTIEYSKGLFRALLDYHKVVGAAACVVLLLLSTTGLMWSFEWYRNGVADIFSIKDAPKKEREGVARQIESSHYWEKIQAAVEAQCPQYQSAKIDNKGAVTVVPREATHQRWADSYRYDTTQGLVLISKYGDNRDRGYMMGWAYVLHTGKWAGVFSKWLTLIAALIGAALPLTGYWLYLKRKIHKN